MRFANVLLAIAILIAVLILVFWRAIAEVLVGGLAP
jgi:hypothetical protein